MVCASTRLQFIQIIDWYNFIHLWPSHFEKPLHLRRREGVVLYLLAAVFDLFVQRDDGRFVAAFEGVPFACHWAGLPETMDAPRRLNLCRRVQAWFQEKNSRRAVEVDPAV